MGVTGAALTAAEATTAKLAMNAQMRSVRLMTSLRIRLALPVRRSFIWRSSEHPPGCAPDRGVADCVPSSRRTGQGLVIPPNGRSGDRSLGVVELKRAPASEAPSHRCASFLRLMDLDVSTDERATGHVPGGRFATARIWTGPR